MAAEPLGRLETAQLMARLGRKLPPISRLYGIKVQPEDVARAEVGILRDRRLAARSKGAPASSGCAATGAGYISLPHPQGGPRKIAAEMQVRSVRPSKEDVDKPLTSRRLVVEQPPVLEASSRRDTSSSFYRAKPAVPRARDVVPTLPKPPTSDDSIQSPPERLPEKLPPDSLANSEGMRLRKRYRIFVADDSPLWAERRAARARREKERSGVSEDAAEGVEQSAAQ